MTHAYTRPFSSGVYTSPTGTVTTLDSISYGVTIPASPMDVPVPPTEGFPVSIAGRNYMIDTSFEPYRREAYRHKSLPPQRQSLHYTNIADDGTISTEGLWRREARDWALGAGQIYLDRNKSDSARFYRSKGIDPWQQWQTTLLPDTLAQYTSSSSSNPIKAIRCSNFVYIVDGNSVYFTSAWSGATTAVINPQTYYLSKSGTTITVSTTGGFPPTGRSTPTPASQAPRSPAVPLSAVAGFPQPTRLSLTSSQQQPPRSMSRATPPTQGTTSSSTLRKCPSARPRLSRGQRTPMPTW